MTSAILGWLSCGTVLNSSLHHVLLEYKVMYASLVILVYPKYPLFFLAFEAR